MKPNTNQNCEEIIPAPTEASVDVNQCAPPALVRNAAEELPTTSMRSSQRQRFGASGNASSINPNRAHSERQLTATSNARSTVQQQACNGEGHSCSNCTKRHTSKAHNHQQRSCHTSRRSQPHSGGCPCAALIRNRCGTSVRQLQQYCPQAEQLEESIEAQMARHARRSERRPHQPVSVVQPQNQSGARAEPAQMPQNRQQSSPTRRQHSAAPRASYQHICVPAQSHEIDRLIQQPHLLILCEEPGQEQQLYIVPVARGTDDAEAEQMLAAAINYIRSNQPLPHSCNRRGSTRVRNGGGDARPDDDCTVVSSTTGGDASPCVVVNNMPAEAVMRERRSNTRSTANSTSQPRISSRSNAMRVRRAEADSTTAE